MSSKFPLSQEELIVSKPPAGIFGSGGGGAQVARKKSPFLSEGGISAQDESASKFTPRRSLAISSASANAASDESLLESDGELLQIRVKVKSRPPSSSSSSKMADDANKIPSISDSQLDHGIHSSRHECSSPSNDGRADVVEDDLIHDHGFGFQSRPQTTETFIGIHDDIGNHVLEFGSDSPSAAKA